MGGLGKDIFERLEQRWRLSKNPPAEGHVGPGVNQE